MSVRTYAYTPTSGTLAFLGILVLLTASRSAGLARELSYGGRGVPDAPLVSGGRFAAGTPAYLPILMKMGTVTPIPTSTVTPTPTIVPTQEAGWLGYINFLRSLGQLPPLTENSSWSYGCGLHARYMVKNGVIIHDEDPANQWYTPEGHAASGSSNLMVSSSTSATDEDAIDLWLSGPFHSVGVIDPSLLQTGFGSYREAVGS